VAARRDCCAGPEDALTGVCTGLRPHTRRMSANPLRRDTRRVGPADPAGSAGTAIFWTAGRRQGAMAHETKYSGGSLAAAVWMSFLHGRREFIEAISFLNQFPACAEVSGSLIRENVPDRAKSLSSDGRSRVDGVVRRWNSRVSQLCTNFSEGWMEDTPSPVSGPRGTTIEAVMSSSI